MKIMLKSKQPSKRIFSGIQPTGNLHIGNYLGAIKNWIKLQEEDDCIYSIVDLHAMTVPNNLLDIKNSTLEVAAAVIASGIDPKKSILFNQSNVPQHTELAWIFNCIARIGWLNRMTQFKEKAGKKKDNATVGLFSYPVLMAADILLYKATHVPVGEDQKQHLELTRDIASSFNTTFNKTLDKDFFHLPEPIILGPAKRIMSLRDGKSKMSKSDTSDGSRINLMDNKDQIYQKIKRAKTDQHPIPDNINDLDDRPEALNLFNIYASFSNKSVKEILQQFSGKGFAQFKESLSDLIINDISPITKEMKHLMNNKDEIIKILIDGSNKAQEIANEVLIDIKKIIGINFKD